MTPAETHVFQFCLFICLQVRFVQAATDIYFANDSEPLTLRWIGHVNNQKVV